MLTRREFAFGALASAGLALRRVPGDGAVAWRCEVFGPAYSRAEYWASERSGEVVALFAPGVLERGRYVVRVTCGGRVEHERVFDRA